MKHRGRLFFAIAATLGAISACGAGGGDDDDSASNGNPNLGTAGSTNIGPTNPSGGGTSAMVQPEQELDRAFKVPVVSGHWVWTANPESGRVALIDATTFTVKTALAGAGPTYLTALPPGRAASRALVINTQSHDATLLSADESGEIQSPTTLPVHIGANAWAVTADGRFAIAWTDASVVSKADPSEGFQDITVLDLAGKTPSSKRLSVGYRPARVFMDDDNSYAYVVTDAGIDVVDLKSNDGPSVQREVELSAHPASDTAARDVNLTPNGEWAFVSRLGADYVTVVKMADGALRDITLPGAVTDLDLSADASMAVAIVRNANPLVAAGMGTGGEGGTAAAGVGGAVAAVGGNGSAGVDAGSIEVGGSGVDVSVGGGGDASAVAGGAAAAAGAGGGAGSPAVGAPMPEQVSVAVLLPVASIFDQPAVFDSVRISDLFGSVELGAKGTTALLYSNGVPSTHLTLLQLATREHRTLDLKLPVFSATASPDGAHAIALLAPAAGSKQPGAFAVVPIAKNLPPKIQGTQAVTVPLAAGHGVPAMVAVDDTRALVTVTDGANVSVAYLVRMPELTVEPFPLDSVPLAQASGLVPEANQAFIAQQHPEGRITFIDLDTKAVHTLTGFELAAKGSK